MKVSEAEELACPFMSHPEIPLNCITTKCMAWETTETIVKISTDSEFLDTKEAEIELCPSGSYSYKDMKFIGNNYKEYTFTIDALEPQDCEGYCQRISNE